MANEITVTVSGKLVNGELNDTFKTKKMQIDQTSQLKYDEIANASTLWGYQELGAAITPGVAFVENLSTACQAQIGLSDGAGGFAPFLGLKPQESFVFRLNSTMAASTDLGFRASTNSGSALIRFNFWSD